MTTISQLIHNYSSSTYKPQAKPYLSFDHQKGFSITELNLCQRLGRYLFGLYPSTHLSVVQSGYNEPLTNEELDIINAQPLLLKVYWTALYTLDVQHWFNSYNNLNLKGDQPKDINTALNRLKTLADIAYDQKNYKVSEYLTLPTYEHIPVEFKNPGGIPSIITEKERRLYKLSPRINTTCAKVCETYATYMHQLNYHGVASDYLNRNLIFLGITRLCTR